MVATRVHSIPWHRFAGLALLLFALASGVERAKADPDVFESFARELLDLIESADLRRLETARPGRKLRLSIVPFDQARIPISIAAAEELNRSLMAELVRLSARRHVFVALDAMRDIIRHMTEVGGLDSEGRDVISGLLSRAQDQDVYIVGKMRSLGKSGDVAKISLSYQAVRKGATTLEAQTPARIIELGNALLDLPLLSLNQAVKMAVTALADGAHDMTELHLGGIRFQDSGAQPAFAVYLQGSIASGLAKAFENVISERRLEVHTAQLGSLDDLRGVRVDPKDLRRENFDKRPGVYVLSGTYWDLGEAIEIRLWLQDSRSATVSWKGWVRPDSVLDKIGLRPTGDPGAASTIHGPLGVTLTTDRGTNPSYRIGEKFNLMVQSESDIWLYCFYRQADGKTIQIFPNQHSWSHELEPRLAGGRLHTLPGETTFPFDFVLRTPAGVERVQCFAASRDVTGELPEALRGRSFDPLAAEAARNLSRSFAGLRDADVSERSLVITVQPAAE